MKEGSNHLFRHREHFALTQQRLRRKVVEGKPMLLCVHDVRTARAEGKTPECELGVDTAR